MWFCGNKYYFIFLKYIYLYCSRKTTKICHCVFFWIFFFASISGTDINTSTVEDDPTPVLLAAAAVVVFFWN